MSNPVIPLYDRITNTTTYSDIPFDIFLSRIQDGYWQDFVLPIRAMKTKEERTAAKKKVPYVTISGQFEGRADASIKNHSGFIAIDCDDIDPEETKSLICVDRYIYAGFTSISAKGVCFIFKITPEKHREAFAGISEYLFTNYNIVVDPTGVNPSRARFVSFDPHIYINTDAVKFTTYPKKNEPKKVEQIVFTQSDFDAIISQVQQRRVNLCENYFEWVRIGFGIADKFGEAGRNYFHIISAISGKYKPDQCNRQYTACVKSKGSNIATIATFYYYCKQAGISLYSDETKAIISAAANAKKGKRTPADTAKNLQQFENIPIERSEAIINQVFNSQVQAQGENQINQIKQWLAHNYSLRRNEITLSTELNGVPLDDFGRNSIWCKAREIFEKISFEDINRIINSDFTYSYNPIKDFFASHSSNHTGVIDALFSTIETTDIKKVIHFCKKWVVGIVSTVYGGSPSRLMPVLTGKQHNGKSEFWRRILPPELKMYFADISSGMKDNDFNIMMTQKMIVMDDEFEVKNKKEDTALKSLLSKPGFELRLPFGRSNMSLSRLAGLCGTSNETGLISDPTGNTRIIPILVKSVNHNDYNVIDKRMLWSEAYFLYKSGFNYELTQQDLIDLTNLSTSFESYSAEYESLLKYCFIPQSIGLIEKMTATEIKNRLEILTVQKLSAVKLGKELKRLGYQQDETSINGKSCRLYHVYFGSQPQVGTVVFKGPVAAQDYEF